MSDVASASYFRQNREAAPVLYATLAAQALVLVYLGTQFVSGFSRYDAGPLQLAFQSGFALPAYAALAAWFCFGIALLWLLRKRARFSARSDGLLVLLPAFMAVVAAGKMLAVSDLDTQLADSAHVVFGAQALTGATAAQRLLGPVWGLVLTLAGLQLSALSALFAVRCVETHPARTVSTQLLGLAGLCGLVVIWLSSPSSERNIPIPLLLQLQAISGLIVIVLCSRQRAALPDAAKVFVCSASGLLCSIIGQRFWEYRKAHLLLGDLESFVRDWVSVNQQMYTALWLLVALALPLVLAALISWYQAEPPAAPASDLTRWQRFGVLAPVVGVTLFAFGAMQWGQKSTLELLNAKLLNATPDDVRVPQLEAVVLTAEAGPTLTIGSQHTRFVGAERFATTAFLGPAAPALNVFPPEIAQSIPPLVLADQALNYETFSAVLRALQSAGFAGLGLGINGNKSLGLPAPFEQLKEPFGMLPLRFAPSSAAATPANNSAANHAADHHATDRGAAAQAEAGAGVRLLLTRGRLYAYGKSGCEPYTWSEPLPTQFVTPKHYTLTLANSDLASASLDVSPDISVAELAAFLASSPRTLWLLHTTPASAERQQTWGIARCEQH